MYLFYYFEFQDTNKCELPSEKHYITLNNVTITDTSKKFCDLNETLVNKYPLIEGFCFKLASHLENFKNSNEMISEEKKKCKSLKFWFHDYIINTVETRSIITYIMLLYSVWSKFKEANKLPNTDECNTTFTFVSIDHLGKRKKMYDFNDNYKELQCAFQKKNDCKVDATEDCKEICNVDCNGKCKEDCKDKYCTYFLDIINIHNEFEQVCAGTNKQRCPDFWDDFKNNYLSISNIEELCQKVYEEHGFYKVKMSLGEEGEEKYVDQYESTYMFSFFEKFIGYSIKKFLYKLLYYSKYTVLPILLILLFYFFMKKLSLFGSKISSRVDDLRKMWRNVQGVTNPATLLHPPKPPFGGNKMGLPYVPK
ncbi:PIR protein [Plasmodium ovale]|uniref:PIR protein n=1 Tax=Plasmodium ovale TaxID=36330 RepID=A0A1C3KJW5_PLAOA|nr:PIR protein [Plasmodium ovale]